MGGDSLDQFPLLQPSTNVFQHVDAFVPALSQGPREQGRKQSRTSVERLKIGRASCRERVWSAPVVGLVITEGTVVTPGGRFAADLGIVGGRRAQRGDGMS